MHTAPALLLRILGAKKWAVFIKAIALKPSLNVQEKSTQFQPIQFQPIQSEVWTKSLKICTDENPSKLDELNKNNPNC